MRVLKRILLTFLGLLLFTGGVIGGYTFYSISNVTNSISQDNDDLGIDDNTLTDYQKLMSKYNFNENEIINIALFGIDSRDESGDSHSRSDSIIIATIDTKNHAIKLSSIMRDSYVAVEGHGHTKINHAYAYGGPQLALKTLNQNFGLNLKNYVTVDFFGLADIIDAIGGVEVTVKDYEVNEINKYIKEVAHIKGVTPDLLTNAGTQRLSGAQAVSYGRIRKVGNGDYERTERQRTIIIAMLEELKNANLSELLKLVNDCSSYVETNLSVSQGFKLALNVLQNMKGFNIQQERFPQNGDGGLIDGVWYMCFDLESERAKLKNFIYGLDAYQENTSTN